MTYKEFKAKVENRFNEGSKLGFVKDINSIFGLGLKEAKELSDKYFMYEDGKPVFVDNAANKIYHSLTKEQKEKLKNYKE